MPIPRPTPARPARPTASPLPRRTVLAALGATAVLGALPRPASAAEAAAAKRPYPLLLRGDWGADESLRFTADGTEIWPPDYYPVQTLTVHHTATPNSDPDPAATVRAIYRYHAVDQDWGDIGYHFLVDESGRAYEGRWSGTDGTPAHDAKGKMVNAAHVGGYNAGNLGIALLGTLTDQAPTPAARDTLVQLLAELAEQHGIDPLTTVTYVNPISGATKNVPALSGHRDWAATECPGSTLYGQLADIRDEVALGPRNAP